MQCLIIFRPNDFDYEEPDEDGNEPVMGSGSVSDVNSPRGPFTPQTPGLAFSPYPAASPGYSGMYLLFVH